MKRGQVWVETVIYTLIAFVIIGAVLAYAKPKIQEMQDKAVIEQSIELMRNLDDTISNIGEAGNQREVPLGIKKGKLIIDGENNKIFFEILSRYQHSEPDVEFTNLGIKELTKKAGSLFNVTLTLDYSATKNISYENKDKILSLTKSSTGYRLFLKNIGADAGGLTTIDFRLG